VPVGALASATAGSFKQRYAVPSLEGPVHFLWTSKENQKERIHQLSQPAALYSKEIEDSRKPIKKNKNGLSKMKE
jgi:hypothetical protein